MVLSILGELERFTSEVLYPYRYVITPLMVVAVLGAALFAVKQGMHLVLWRHRVHSVVVGAPLLVVALVAGDYLVSPLWERSRLEEASPLQAVMESLRSEGNSAAMTMGMQAPETATAGPRTTHRGMFKGADDFHFGRGDALLISTSGGGSVLRFENFSVRNGPDLYVYLSRDEGGRRVEESLNLGRLKATDGAFNYEIPSNVDLKDVRSVVVWCRQFTTLFAVAPLMMN